MKHLLFFLSSLLLYYCCCGQGEGNIWATNRDSSINFNNNPPTLDPKANIAPYYLGIATVCDADGNLLFYTIGDKTWNRNHLLMPNGLVSGIPGSLGEALITSVPNQPGRYYIFANYSTPFLRASKTFYSIVDMSLDNGLGDIVPGQKAIVIKDGAEALAVVKGDNCNIWLMTTSKRELSPFPVDPAARRAYIAYRITSRGVDTANPVITYDQTSGMSSFQGQQWHEYRFIPRHVIFSPQGDKMAVSFLGDGFFRNGIVLYDFDAATGMLSNGKLFGNMYVSSGGPRRSGELFQKLCFSPDGSKLYVGFDGGSYPGGIDQYDVSLPTGSAINQSWTEVYSTCPGCGFLSFGWIEGIKAAPDGKIYFSPGVYWINIPILTIPNPNLPGLASGLSPSSITTLAAVSFPPENALLPIDKDTAYNNICLKLAGNNLDSLVLPTDIGGNAYIWHTGDTGSYRVALSAGIYVARYVSGCRWRVDSFIVVAPPVVFDTCPQQSYAWSAPVPGATSFTYTWKDSDGNVVREVSNANGDTLMGLGRGNYLLTITAASGCKLDFPFSANTIPAPDAGFDLDSVACTGQILSYSNTNGSKWHWDFGDGRVSNTPTGQHIYHSPGIYNVSLTVDNGRCVSTETKQVVIKELNLVLTSDKDIYDVGEEATLTTSSEIDYAIVAWLPQELFSNQTAIWQYLKAGSNIDYKAVGLSAEGCPDTAVIRLLSQPFVPNAFSPNGDGINDYFRPANPGVFITQFNVYNRFGQLVWSASGEQANKGWDGMHQDKPADVGTYFWKIEIQIPSGRTEYRKGDVNLLR